MFSSFAQLHLRWHSLEDFKAKALEGAQCGIYCFRNIKNGKHYVGQASKTLSGRILSHCYCAFRKQSAYALHAALRKHGRESFLVAVLIHGLTEAELDEAEAFYMDELSSCGKNGYNMRPAENVGRGYAHASQTREKIRNIKKGKPLPTAQREALKKSVLQLDKHTGAIIRSFASLSEASAAVSVPCPNISKCCHGQLKTAGGFSWMFTSSESIEKGAWSVEEKLRSKVRAASRRDNLRAVEQLELTSAVVVRRFDSLKAAVEQTGIFNVSAVCRGRRRSAGGFRWRYADLHD